jgi:FtsP/CotA-like multicopper oxidase with cupredoxin domain
MQSQPGNQKNGTVIPYGETYKAEFEAGTKGTYLYRATAGNRKWDGLPYYTDSQLYGAFIIDPQNEKPDPDERIFMIGIWNDTLTGTNTLSNEELAYKWVKLAIYRTINIYSTPVSTLAGDQCQ